jgi:CRISPR-associated protein Csy2
MIRNLLSTMRFAGGSIIHQRHAPGQFITPKLVAIVDDAEERDRQFRQLRRRWLPGFALVSRDDFLRRRLQQLQVHDASATELDAWLDLSRFNWRSRVEVKEGKNEVIWAHDRPADAGWIVPIPVGYGALSDLYDGGQVVNARDTTTPFQFVESLYSIGQWVSPHRLDSVNDLLWWADSQSGQGLYRCRNGYAPPAMDDEPEPAANANAVISMR